MTVIVLLKLLLTGAVAGLSAGFLGIGGGAVLTPLCFLIFPTIGIGPENLMKIIFGTNMFLVMVFSASAVLKHKKNSKVDGRMVFTIAPLAMIGSLLGAFAASRMGSADLKTAFAILLTVSSLLIVIRGSTKPSGDSTRKKPLLPHQFIPILGFITGMAGAFLGIGGGVIMIPALILIFSYPVSRVAATSSSVIIFIGLAGTLSYMWHGWSVVDLPGLSTGYVWWSAAIPIALGGIPMARVGAMLNAKTHDKTMQRIFGAVMFIIALKMLFF